MTIVLESPFLAHFHTNYVPDDSEVETIQNHIIPPARAEYLRLEALIRDLSIQHDNLKDYIDSHMALISPFRRMPHDVVQSIFLACLPTARNAVMAVYEAPLILGRICSAWRAVAYSTPMLWASLNVSLGFIQADERRVLALTEWLARSAACPLSLSITGYHPGDTPTLVNPVVDIILKVAERWRCITLCDLRDVGLRQIANTSAPALEVVSIRDEFQELPDFPILHGTHLNDISLYVYALPHSLGSAFSAADHLLHLSLISTSDGRSGMQGETILRLLRQHPRIVTLALHIGRDDGFQGEQPVLVPCLKKFKLMTSTMYDASGFNRLLELLIMPQLLCLEFPPTESAVSDTLLFTSIRRFPLIESLAIFLPSFTRQSLCATLRELPSLKSMIVNAFVGLGHPTPSTIDPEAFFRLLTADPDDTNSLLCPALTNLHIFNSHSLMDDTIRSFLDRRTEREGPFRSLKVFSCSAAPTTPLDLEPFRARGVQVSFFYPPIAPPVVIPVVSAWAGLNFHRDFPH
ncbi:hypothetical protein C8R43DRAFT_1004429 [Mycena crocata]|nr:hypothetical protein C8R43DRAFT_1004429 [Mycena crocata]